MNNVIAKEPVSRWDIGMNAVYMITCALHGSVPAVDAVRELDALYGFCNGHSVISMVAMALESYWQMVPPEDPEQAKSWKQAKEKVIRKNILLNAERERILQYLDSIGCWYLPLKGSFLQYDYPKFGMRQMSDNDILYDTSFEKEVYNFMCGSGYTAKSFGKNNHDEYIKSPVYNFEMHRRLFSPLYYPVLSEYYCDTKRLMVKDSGNSCGYHLSDEDFYIYMTAHAYKHFSYGGTGIRSLVDVYVFLQKHGESIDWDYVETEEKRLDILDYERRCRHLSQKVFGEPRRDLALSDEELELLGSFLGAGTYGNKKMAVENVLGKLAREAPCSGMIVKLRYFWQRMFPSLEFMATLEPDLLEDRWKLPLAHLKRLVKVIFQKPMRVIREITYLVNTKIDKN